MAIIDDYTQLPFHFIGIILGMIAVHVRKSARDILYVEKDGHIHLQFHIAIVFIRKLQMTVIRMLNDITHTHTHTHACEHYNNENMIWLMVHLHETYVISCHKLSQMRQFPLLD